MQEPAEKTYVFLAEGFEEIEALAVVDILRRAQMDTLMVSISGSRMVTGSHGIRVEADIILAEADFDQAQTIVLPGGVPGTPNLAACGELIKHLKEFDRSGKRIAAICAAPSILGGLGILDGKRAVCYPGWEDKLDGAVLQPGAKTVVDGNVTTGRGMGTANDFALAIVAQVKGSGLAEQLRESIQYSF